MIIVSHGVVDVAILRVAMMKWSGKYGAVVVVGIISGVSVVVVIGNGRVYGRYEVVVEGP